MLDHRSAAVGPSELQPWNSTRVSNAGLATITVALVLLTGVVWTSARMWGRGPLDSLVGALLVDAFVAVVVLVWGQR